MTAPTTTLKDSLDGIGELLSASCERYHVPGAVLAVRRDDEMVEYANGVLNLTTGVETTTDSVFQIGSITKVFTTTLIMQLVDEGRLDLDSPVCTYLPEFTLANREYSAAITVRQLVTHTSGMDGDYFHDTGRGADAVERYVMSLGALPSLHAPGAMWSYCNGGFVVAGRIVEKLTGLTWDQAIEQRIFKPAGLATMGTLPEVAILSRAAAGHVMDEEGNWKRAPVWLLAPSNGPAGATPFAAARDLLTFAWTHLNGGTAEGGTRILSEKGVRAMQQEEVHLPGRGIVDHWGLGWMLFDWGPERIIGHDGGTIGQSSFLRISPEKRFGAALLTNGGNVQALSRKVLGEVFARGAGIQMAPLPEADAGVTIDPARYVGTYAKLSSRTEVVEEDGRLVATTTQTGPLSGPPAVQELSPIDEQSFATVFRNTGLRSTLTFLEPADDGRFMYVRDTRLSRRVSR